jgi:hypothetical protein
VSVCVFRRSRTAIPAQAGLDGGKVNGLVTVACSVVSHFRRSFPNDVVTPGGVIFLLNVSSHLLDLLKARLCILLCSIEVDFFSNEQFSSGIN